VECELKRFDYEAAYDTAPASHSMALAALTRLVPTSQRVFGTDFPYRTAASRVTGLAAYEFGARDPHGTTLEGCLAPSLFTGRFRSTRG
jgi:hypothetical protein